MPDSKLIPSPSWKRIIAIASKETRELLRDPSVFLIAFILPVILLFLFAYAVSLDIRTIPISLIVEDSSPSALSLRDSFINNRYFQVTITAHRDRIDEQLTNQGFYATVIISAEFNKKLQQHNYQDLLQIITDGTQPNRAQFTQQYIESAFLRWLSNQHNPSYLFNLEPRFWFNPELESRRALIPGSIAIIMTMIGTLLTALVIAKEWEHGTMEGLFSTPVTIREILIGKLMPYFLLGLIATLLATFFAVTLFDVSLRGSMLALLFLSTGFMIPALGQGLLISAITKNQFLASQLALLSGFLPALFLSGYLYEIASMPQPLQIISRIIPARYFNNGLQTVFLSGDDWLYFGQQFLAMLIIGIVFFLLSQHMTKKSLET